MSSAALQTFAVKVFLVEMESASPITVSLDQLKNGIDFKTLDAAFGPDSLGIIVVEGLLEDFHTKRAKVLRLLSTLARLPESELNKLEDEESMWLTGWSRGKEKLENGRPDFYKGSYYVNCAFHKDSKLEGPPPEIVDEFKDLPMYTAPNIWPSKELQGLDDFESDAKGLCNLIIDVAELVAASCDCYIQANSGYGMKKDYLQLIVNSSTATKARFLHYYPPLEDSHDDAWCGEHLDHSCITGLTSAMFLTEKDGEEFPLDKSPDPTAGLYIKNRNGDVVKVNIPPTCLAFQTGSALQEISRGKFKAVPHYVQASKTPGVSRNTLAVFCQPDLNEKVNDDENFAQYAMRILRGNH